MIVSPTMRSFDCGISGLILLFRPDHRHKKSLLSNDWVPLRSRPQHQLAKSDAESSSHFRASSKPAPECTVCSGLHAQVRRSAHVAPGATFLGRDPADCGVASARFGPVM